MVSRAEIDPMKLRAAVAASGHTTWSASYAAGMSHDVMAWIIDRPGIATPCLRSRFERTLRVPQYSLRPDRKRR